MLISALLVALFVVEPPPGAAPETQSPATSPAATPAPEPAPSLPPPSEAVVTMLNSGDAPREQLRLALKVGEVQFAVMEMDMQMKMAMDGAAQPAPKMPSFNMNMRIKVEEALPDGRWKYIAEFTSVDVTPKEGTPPEMVTIMQATMAEMVGMKIAAEIDPTGRQQNLQIVSKITNPMLLQQLESMKQSMSQMAIRLPEPEVGADAKWEVEANAAFGGIASRQRSTYRLLSRSGNTVKLGISTRQSPAERNAPIKNLPAGMTGTLVDLSGDGNGELVYDLSRVMPRQGRVVGESVVNMNMEGHGMKAKLDTHTSLVMTIREVNAPGKAPAPK
ncbi:MAG: hypothetical protein J0L78_01715 [Planctomycetes bacterium]|nr:hypothetical protein [Planctomycetota bacterium]